jgi:hypothetical protein
MNPRIAKPVTHSPSMAMIGAMSTVPSGNIAREENPFLIPGFSTKLKRVARH